MNFDVPMVPEDYIHRVGRTARAEATGDAFTFVSHEEEADLARIERAIGKRLPRVTVPDFDYAARPPARLEMPSRRTHRRHPGQQDRRSGAFGGQGHGTCRAAAGQRAWQHHGTGEPSGPVAIGRAVTRTGRRPGLASAAGTSASSGPGRRTRAGTAVLRSWRPAGPRHACPSPRWWRTPRWSRQSRTGSPVEIDHRQEHRNAGIRSQGRNAGTQESGGRAGAAARVGAAVLPDTRR